MIFNRRFLLHSVLATIFIFSIMIVAGKLFRIFEILDPVGDALEDIEVTDIVFSQIREIPPADTNLVLVNIGSLPRRGIADLLQIINESEPAAIGIDAFFRKLKEPNNDQPLASQISKSKNVVLISELGNYNSDINGFDHLNFSHPIFSGNADHGYANLNSSASNQINYKVCRNFSPKESIGDSVVYAFGVKMASYIDKSAVNKFLSRNKPLEIINYRGNINDFGKSNFGTRFYAIDWPDVFEKKFTPELFDGKLVLLGYMGDTFQDPSWQDKFYTPLNNVYAGKTNPDMFGVIIHANIISMILNGDYLDKMSYSTAILVAIIIAYLNVCLFLIIHIKLPTWYDGLTKLIQLIEVLALFLLIILVFDQFQYKMNLTIAIIAILLAGDALEVYLGVVINVAKKFKTRIKRLKRNQIITE